MADTWLFEYQITSGGQDCSREWLVERVLFVQLPRAWGRKSLLHGKFWWLAWYLGNVLRGPGDVFPTSSPPNPYYGTSDTLPLFPGTKGKFAVSILGEIFIMQSSVFSISTFLFYTII